jgi:non-specific serine/threonine protein kinase
MLETIREFGAEQLERSGEEGEIRRGHARYVRTLVEAAEPDLMIAKGGWLGRLDEEHDNIRAALRWSISTADADTGLRIAGVVWRFWSVRSLFAEGRRWLDELLSLPAAALRTVARAKALGARGSLAYYTNDADEARRCYEESLAIARELANPRAEAEGVYNLAFGHLIAGEVDAARLLLEQASRIYGELGDRLRQAHAKTALGMISMHEGDAEAGALLTEEALTTFLEAQDQWGITWAAGQLSALALMRGDHERCRTLMLRSLEHSEAVGASGWYAVAIEGLGALAVHEGNPERGVRLAGAADRLRELAGGAAPRAIVMPEDPLELVKGTLPQERIDELWHEGRSMRPADAIALARARD